MLKDQITNPISPLYIQSAETQITSRNSLFSKIRVIYSRLVGSSGSGTWSW